MRQAHKLSDLIEIDVSGLERHEAQKKCSQHMWRAIRAGLVSDRRGEPCADCGKPSKHHDHRDWRRPLDVVMVCHSCNIKRGPAAPFEHHKRQRPLLIVRRNRVFERAHRDAPFTVRERVMRAAA